MTKNFVSINSLNTTERAKLRDAVKELNDSMMRAGSETELQKEILAKTAEELGVDKKLVRSMAKAYYKANFNNVVEEFKAFEEFYNIVLLGANSCTPGANP